MSNKDDNVWISKAAEVEDLYETTHKLGTFLLAYQLCLSSVHPLQECQVREALLHLRRKCPNLRICFGKRDGVTWLRRTVTDDIDFEVVNDADEEEIRHVLQTYRYKSETGPLWCARLLRKSKHDSYAMDDGFPHSSQLILGMHHSITDGITFLKTLGCLISLLNDVIAGKQINDEEQIGIFASDLETEKLVSAKEDAIQKDKALLQELSSVSKCKGEGMPMLLKSFRSPEGGEDRTHNLTRVIDRDTTKRFIVKCKSEGVSVHSALTALANGSTVTLLLENEYIRHSYRLCNGQVINLRRYWPGDSSQTLGCHAHFPLNLWVEVSKGYQENFWDLARSINKDLHHHLEKESALLREAYTKLNVREEPSCEDILFSSVPMQSDGSFSNLGNISGYITEGGEHVKPYLLIRQISLHRTDIKNFCHFFHTLRGRLTLNLLYNSKFFAKEVAQKHCNKIFSIMEAVC